jgi:hypothetical protein
MNEEYSEAADNVIAEVLEQHAADRVFWKFVEDYAATVGFDLSTTHKAKTSRLMEECARQYAFIRTEFPAHFRTLSAGNGENLPIVYHIADVAVISGLSVHHFAKSNILCEAYDERVAHHQNLAREQSEREFEAAENARIAEESRRAHQEMVSRNARIPVDGFAIPEAPILTEELEDLAHRFYAQSKGRLVKVRNHVPEDGDDFGYERTSKIFRHYDAALVDEGGEDSIGLTIPEGKVAESSWPVVMMTGPNRGRKASIAAVDFNADGSITDQDLVIVTMPGFVLPERFSDDELVELVRLDMLDYAERAIDVSSASVYIEGTDDQVQVAFEPPLPAVVDPFDEGSFGSKYRLDDWSQRDGINVIDVYLDFDSTSERADKYRSMWTHGVSYTSHGVMEIIETQALPFIPAFVVGNYAEREETLVLKG